MIRIWPGARRALVFGQTVPVAIGRGGVRADKREGDGATPLGRFVITGCWYRADRMALPAPWARPISPFDLWCDAPDHPAYNQAVRAPFHASHERLCRGDRLYDLVLTTDHNAAGLAGRGSAIFVHRWRRAGFPTAGCLAFEPAVLRWLAGRAVPGTPLWIEGSA